MSDAPVLPSARLQTIESDIRYIEKCWPNTFGANMRALFVAYRDLLAATAVRASQEDVEGLRRELGNERLLREQAERHHRGEMEAFKRAGVDFGVVIPQGQTIGVVWIDQLRERAEQAEAALALRAQEK